MAENEKTEHYKIPKPNIANFISDDTPVLQMAFDIIDLLFREFATEIAKKMSSDAELAISDIDGLTEELAKKMASNRTFKLIEMTDVLGFENALDNYILTKAGEGFVLRSALAVIGAHGHAISDVNDLPESLETLAEEISAIVQAMTGKLNIASGTTLASNTVATQLQIQGSGNRVLRFLRANGSRAGTIYSDGTANVLRILVDNADNTVSKLFSLGVDGQFSLPDAPLYANSATRKDYVDQVVAEAGTTYRQVFTASGTWTKPVGFKDDDMFLIEGWGGGGGAPYVTTNASGGGGGGGYSQRFVRYVDLPSTASVAVGAGGVAGVLGDTTGKAGSDSLFGALVRCVGASSASGANGGLGGGNITGTVGIGATNGGDAISPFAGGNGASAAGGGSLYGAGGGGGRNTGSSTNAGGSSSYGGDGGATGQPGVIPGGGGGGNATTSSVGGSGARGEIRITKL